VWGGGRIQWDGRILITDQIQWGKIQWGEKVPTISLRSDLKKIAPSPHTPLIRQDRVGNNMSKN